MLTSNRLEAWLTWSEFVLSLEPQASCLKLKLVLADGLMLVFQHPVTSRNNFLQILGTLGNLGTIGTALMYKSH